MEQQLIVQATPHSVEISRNASGGVSLNVKVYADTPEHAAERAKELFVRLDAEYPAVKK